MYNITVAKIVGAQSSGGGGGASSEVPPTASEPPPVGEEPAGPVPPPPLPTTSHGRGRPSGSFSWLQTATTPTTPQLPHLIAQPSHGQGHGMTYTAFTGLVPPPAAVVSEAVATPPRKLGRPSSLHNSMRGRIIDAIKTRPSLWAGRQTRMSVSLA